MIIPKRFAAATALVAALFTPERPADPVTLRFTVRFVTDSGAPAVALSLRLPAQRDSARTLRLPNEWAGRSGLYRNILGLRSTTPRARIVPTDSAFVVRVIAPPNAPVEIEWRIRGMINAPVPLDAHNHNDIGSSRMQLIGYDALVLPDLPRETPMRTTFVFEGLSEGAAVATSFGHPRPRDSVVTTDASLGSLEHAVYVAGKSAGAIRVQHQDIGGKSVDIVVRDILAISDSALVAAVASVIRAERTFWGGTVPEHYLVTIGPAPQGTLAGTRLTDSFVADIDGKRTLDPDVIELFAHELMHDWIGSALYASPAEGEGQLAWFFEGFTDYLSKRVLRTAGLISDSTYVAWINRSLREHALSPARDSGWATVVRRYWTDYAAKREPYLRGELIALRLDVARLDDALRALRRQAGADGSALTRDSIVSGISAGSSRQAISSMIDAGLTGAVAPLPSVLGGVCVNVRNDRLALWDPGFELDASLAAKEVHGVRSDGPAARAGLTNGLKILGVSVWRGDVSKEMMVAVADDTVKKRIIYLPVGRDSVDVQVVERRANCPQR